MLPRIHLGPGDLVGLALLPGARQLMSLTDANAGAAIARAARIEMTSVLMRRRMVDLLEPWVNAVADDYRMRPSLFCLSGRVLSAPGASGGDAALPADSRRIGAS